MHVLPVLALVFAVLAFIRTRRHAWACGGHGGGFPHARWRGGHRGHGMRSWFGALSERLDLSPAQEKVVRIEVDGLRDKLRGMVDERDRSRADLANAVRGDVLSSDALDAMFARHDERLIGLRIDLAAALGRVHETLDDRQRQRLADLLASGRGGPWYGPYR